VTLIILVVAFGAMLAAGIPVLLGLTSVFAAFGLTTLSSQLIPTGESTQILMMLIGMAVGVDYSLFYLKREREERARGAGKLAALEAAAATSGHAVLVSGMTVDGLARPACSSWATPRAAPWPSARSWSSASPCSAR
jgi:RND superfamily putative drug exporter